MYAKFFGLRQAPFSIAPDPRYLFMSERHREALAHLLYGLGGGGGFVLLTGEIGAGKTTVCRCFLEQVPADCHVAYVFNPKLNALELLRTVCEEFRIPLPTEGAAASVKDLVDALNAFLLQAHAAGRNCVLVIDEAQNLSADVLEQLRLLTNLETSERKLLQIILIGQPELRTMLAQPSLEQLAQRVIARYHLDALSAAETAQYVAHRLGVAGLSTALPFDRAALARIHRLARGVPRRINLLCDRALLGAYARGTPRVGRRLVDQAAREVFGEPAGAAGRGRRLAWGAGLAATALAVGAAVVFAPLPGLDGGRARPAVSAASASAASAAAGVASAGGTPAAAASTALAAGASAAGAAGDAASAATGAAPALLARLPQDADDAWRQLAPAWGLPADTADPCEAWRRQRVQCFRGRSTLAAIRQLDRPGLLRLETAQGTPAYALLTGLGRDDAELRVDGATARVPLAELAQRWTGDYATLWRWPPGYGGEAVDESAPPPPWLARLLDGAGAGPADADLRARLRSFQRAQGLRPDGLAGPLTYMQLNRASGVAEPRLSAGN